MTCPECHGRGVVRVSGMIVSSAPLTCPDCNGSGVISCCEVYDPEPDAKKQKEHEQP